LPETAEGSLPFSSATLMFLILTGNP